ncbi:DUF305 domain-containing protein [Streptomyces sp. NPDC058391]|uniref:DUF305 domain-containing protein n=1 Tax=Streptomyces sp. NPDC058391 TaxID=3346476 RepID=UPI00365EFB46
MSVSLRSPARRRALAAAGTTAVLALGLAACGADSKDAAMPGMGHGGGGSSASASGTFNNADVTFAQMMIPHHQQAVDMAELADGRASDPELKVLATDIEKAQSPEISTMRDWLKSWGKPASPSADSGTPGMDHGGSSTNGSAMPGMMSETDMTGLKAAQGKDFDRKFTQMMIGHHEGAITMAQALQNQGRNADAKKLAGAVVTAQKAEIEKMNKILDRL